MVLFRSFPGNLALVALAVLTPFAALAQETERLDFGGDRYAAGNSVEITETGNDAFVAGNDVRISGALSGDAHAAGNNVTITSEVEGNVYAAGNAVRIESTVGADVTAAGNSVTIAGAGVGGNVRLAGTDVTVAAPVEGAALITTESLVLDTTITGDLHFTGRSISFGENAVVMGDVLIRSGEAIDVPATVAGADRVSFEQMDVPDWPAAAGDVARETAWSFWPAFLPGFAILVAVFIVGVIWIALMRRRSEIGYLVSARKPFKSLCTGILALSMFIGLVFVLGMTLFGLPLMPIAILLVLLAWLMGYISGAYYLARRVIAAFGQTLEPLGYKVLALALGLVFVWLFGLIPIIGWLSQLVVVFLGLGAMTLAALYRVVDAPFHGEIRQEVETAPA